jgi:hypothetical protein
MMILLFRTNVYGKINDNLKNIILNLKLITLFIFFLKDSLQYLHRNNKCDWYNVDFRKSKMIKISQRN